MDAAEKKAFASEFYSRQVIMEELGWKGQRKLAKSKVAVIGVGGMGTGSSLYLALAGVGHSFRALLGTGWSWAPTLDRSGHYRSPESSQANPV